MKKALVIGAMGFAGSALMEELRSCGYETVGADIVSDGKDVIKADMLDKEEASRLISDIKPDVIFNLAGQASPIISWKDINLTMHLNVDLSVNIAEAVSREPAPSPITDTSSAKSVLIVAMFNVPLTS